MADNNAAWPTLPDGRPLYSWPWDSGLTTDERNLKIANYYRIYSLYFASIGNTSASTFWNGYFNTYLDLSGTLGTGYRDTVQAAADAAQAVADAQQVVTDLGG